MTLAKEIFRRRDQSNGPFSQGITHANELLPKAGRFIVDQSVMDAVGRMEKTPFDHLLGALAHARPPFPIMWLEWQDVRGTIGYLVEEIERAQGFHFRRFLSMRRMEDVVSYPVICNLGRIKVTAAGYEHENVAEAQTDPREEPTAVADIIRMLLIINSPSRVVSIDELKDVTRADRIRLAQGRPPLPNLRAIRLDVNRLRKMDEANDSLKPGQTVRSEHFVRGHFKLKNNRIWWWAPHLRNRVESDQPAQPRDYRVIQS